MTAYYFTKYKLRIPKNIIYFFKSSCQHLTLKILLFSVFCVSKTKPLPMRMRACALRVLKPVDRCGGVRGSARCFRAFARLRSVKLRRLDHRIARASHFRASGKLFVSLNHLICAVTQSRAQAASGTRSTRSFGSQLTTVSLKVFTPIETFPKLIFQPQIAPFEGFVLF